MNRPAHRAQDASNMRKERMDLGRQMSRAQVLKNKMEHMYRVEN